MKNVRTLFAALAIFALFAGCSNNSGSSSTATTTPAASDTTMKPAADLPVIKVATDTTFPPMEFIDDSKAIVGFDIDLFNLVATAAGYKPEYTTVNWDGIFQAVINGTYDIVVSSVTITDDRKKTLDFSDSYVAAGQVIVVPVADTTTTTLDQLNKGKKKVGVQQGTTGDTEVRKFKAIDVKGYQDIGLAFADLKNGNLDAVVIDSPVAADYALQNINLKGSIKIVGDLITAEPYGYAVKKGNTELVDKINKALADVKASGKLDELKAKWGIK